MLKVAFSFLGKLQFFSSTMTSSDTVGSTKYPQKSRKLIHLLLLL